MFQMWALQLLVEDQEEVVEMDLLVLLVQQTQVGVEVLVVKLLVLEDHLLLVHQALVVKESL